MKWHRVTLFPVLAAWPGTQVPGDSSPQSNLIHFSKFILLMLWYFFLQACLQDDYLTTSSQRLLSSLFLPLPNSLHFCFCCIFSYSSCFVLLSFRSPSLVGERMREGRTCSDVAAGCGDSNPHTHKFSPNRAPPSSQASCSLCVPTLRRFRTWKKKRTCGERMYK